jgi:hypothetical protein
VLRVTSETRALVARSVLETGAKVAGALLEPAFPKTGVGTVSGLPSETRVDACIVSGSRKARTMVLSGMSKTWAFVSRRIEVFSDSSKTGPHVAHIVPVVRVSGHAVPRSVPVPEARRVLNAQPVTWRGGLLDRVEAQVAEAGRRAVRREGEAGRRGIT